jgi:phosphatidylserine/phosphatidylglycerophosphate/cardiolipin synthase-like enzyme
MLGVIHAGALVQMTEFCPDPYQRDDPDEYLVLTGTGSLDGLTISDGEGGFRFPPGTIINGQMVIARNGLAYEESHGNLPDFEWLDSSPKIPDVIGGDPLRLANAKDQLMLYDGSTLVQKVSWPEDVKPREGQIHYLENGVWDPRPLMIGQSRLEPAVFHHVAVTAFVSPDCSNEVFSQVMENASREVLINMYEFSSPTMGDALVSAKERGVDVRVLIEGGPVGGISPEEKSLVWKINSSGIPIYSMTSTKTEHTPYRYDHAKYVVIDKNSLLITSENFKYSGFPPQGMGGNRGWGVYLEDPELAGYFSHVFELDSSSRSVVPYKGLSGESETVPAGKHPSVFSPAQFEDATITPVVSPDTSYLIADLITGATKSVDIEQAYIKNETPYTLNPYLAAAVNASRRGVHVRVLLDSYWFNVEGPNDNDEMAALINRIGAAEHIPLEARCIDLSVNQLEKIHNKGVIVDDDRVLVSSINWNSNSPNFNREAGVIIEQPGVATYFKTVFDEDWAPSVSVQNMKTDYLKIAAAIVIIAILIGIYYRRRR